MTQIPFDQIIKIGQRTLLYRDTFNVSWTLTRACNYSCSYCWPYAHTSLPEATFRPKHIMLATIDEIKRQARNNGFNSFHFSFSGGEPTVHPYFLDLLKHYQNDPSANMQTFHMTTNLSRSLNWYRKFATATASLHRVSVTASLHSEYVNNNAQLEKFADKHKLLQDNDINTTVNMVMVPEWFDRDYDIAMYFNKRGINVTLKPQSNSNASAVVEGYTPKQLSILQHGLPQQPFTDLHMSTVNKQSTRPSPNEYIKAIETKLNKPNAPKGMQVDLYDKAGNVYHIDQAERFNAFGFNKFEGWQCEAGYRSLIIREPCGSVKRSWSCHDEILGNIETGFTLFNKPRECITPSCVASVCSKIPKYKRV